MLALPAIDAVICCMPPFQAPVVAYIGADPADRRVTKRAAGLKQIIQKILAISAAFASGKASGAPSILRGYRKSQSMLSDR